MKKEFLVTLHVHEGSDTKMLATELTSAIQLALEAPYLLYGVSDVEVQEVELDILETINRDGGITLSPVGSPIPTSGYIVSLPEWGEVLPLDKTTEDDIISFVNTVPEDKLFGAWVDDGVLYLDVSEHFKDKKEAIKAGKKRAQKAIWDLNEGVEIRL